MAPVRLHDRIDPVPDPVGGFAAYVGRPVWNEARRPLEARRLRQSDLWAGVGVPEGHGRPVILIPGFLAARRSTDALGRILRDAGWHVLQPDVGRNAGPAITTIEAALEHARAGVERTGEKVHLIGHSRGGQLARVLAVAHPDLVDQVIVAGTPLRTKYPKYLVVKVPAEVLDKGWRWGLLGRADPEAEDWVDRLRYADLPAGVELVSVWSKLDGVVDWRLCLDAAATNIEVRCSHQGMFNSVPGIRGILAGLAGSPLASGAPTLSPAPRR